MATRPERADEFFAPFEGEPTPAWSTAEDLGRLSIESLHGEPLQRTERSAGVVQSPTFRVSFGLAIIALTLYWGTGDPREKTWLASGLLVLGSFLTGFGLRALTIQAGAVLLGLLAGHEEDE